MTETEWLACEDWQPMIAFLSDRWIQRKAVLYICAGLRLLWHLLYASSSQNAVEVAERAADGGASSDEIDTAEYYAETPTFGYDFYHGSVRTWNRDSSGVRRLIEMGVYSEEDIHQEGDGDLGNEATRSRLLNAAGIAEYALITTRRNGLCENLLRHLSRQEEWPGGWLVREIIGNPFHSFSTAPSVLAWNDGIVPRLAQATYDDRILPAGTLDNTRLLILGDALEEAGCTDEQIMTHLRGGGEHYRGCWVIDMLLAKK